MRRGFSLLELIVTLAAAAVVTAITLPRLGGVLDWLAVDAEAAKVTTGLAVTRHVEIMRGTRARLVVAVDSLRIDRWDGRTWTLLVRWVGPGEAGVLLVVSNPEAVSGTTGMGWGAANTTLVMQPG